MSAPQQLYQQLKTNTEASLQALKQRTTLVSIARILAFILILASPYIFLDRSTALFIVMLSIGLISFFVLIKYHQKLSRKKEYFNAIISINEKELKAIEHDFSMFDIGKEFIDPNHFNSYDLDVFGRGSLFQFLNRTITNEGKKKLANQLRNPILENEAILRRQELINELSGEVEWRQNFSATSQTNITSKDEKFLLALADELAIKPVSIKRLRIFVPILIAVGISSVVISIIINNSTFFILNLFLQVIFWGIHSKAIKEITARFGKQVILLQKYKKLLSFIEQFNWKSEEGKATSKQLKENIPATTSINKLVQITSQFDNRNNMLLGVVLNIVFAWDLLFTIKFFAWQKKFGNEINTWIQSVAFIDAINSLANYQFNHPEYNFPTPIDGSFSIEVEEMGHPLIQPTKCINNDFKIKNHPSISIITGANMSGKSTFLRTIGINMILAMAGTPIKAQKMHFTPIQVFSNMRTTDSLFDDESYFFAELKRLKQILAYKAEGHKVLIILDEILKGTNSKDKLYGSQQFIKKLIENDGNVIIATHDLKLTELEEVYPESVRNYCFEIEIKDNQMHFDYKLRRGITEVMNATFLMRQMGIIDQ